jgi:hypothetical protein
MKRYCVCFAGAVGSSKTPIAHYLSLNFGLPIHNNDVVRTEVKEDFGELREDEYIARRDQRIKAMVSTGRSFILDASVDRSWELTKEKLDEAGYEHFLISIDLSKPLIETLYKAKSYHESQKLLDQLFQDHELFLGTFSNDVDLHLNDKTFPERLERSKQVLESWIKKL